MISARILVIEDEIDIRQLLALVLGDAGYTVLEARDAAEGLARLAEDTVELIILDIMMPGMSGWELCRQLKADAATRRIPIVILAVRNYLHHAEAFDASGAEVYLDKPFTRKTLLDCIEEQLIAHAP